jgi:hypothetical protein
VTLDQQRAVGGALGQRGVQHPGQTLQHELSLDGQGTARHQAGEPIVAVRRRARLVPWLGHPAFAQPVRREERHHSLGVGADGGGELLEWRDHGADDIVEHQGPLAHLVHGQHVERRVIAYAREIAPGQHQRDGERDAALPRAEALGHRRAVREQAAQQAPVLRPLGENVPTRRWPRPRRRQRSCERVLAHGAEAERRVELGDERRQHQRVKALVGGGQRLLHQRPAQAAAAALGIRAHGVDGADAYPSPPDHQRELDDADVAHDALALDAPNGVETAVHANPSASARATPVGKRGHTRPSSAARPGSRVGDDIRAL